MHSFFPLIRLLSKRVSLLWYILYISSEKNQLTSSPSPVINCNHVLSHDTSPGLWRVQRMGGGSLAGETERSGVTGLHGPLALPPPCYAPFAGYLSSLILSVLTCRPEIIVPCAERWCKDSMGFKKCMCNSDLVPGTYWLFISKSCYYYCYHDSSTFPWNSYTIMT